ncbi:helix-turn-helix domain-containing protein [Streptomyces sp. NPDC057617]|uniref:helix-turn-helix domain-containing protein n=1 Tax=Streptomyces sp. NPDC057617 TaxID=3346184 RepID=UPI0036B17A00
MASEAAAPIHRICGNERSPRCRISAIELPRKDISHMRVTFRSGHANEPLPRKSAFSGLPNDCIASYGQAAHWKSQAACSVIAPAPAMADTAMREVAEHALVQVNHLVQVASQADAPVQTLAEQAMHFRLSVEALTDRLIHIAHEIRQALQDPEVTQPTQTESERYKATGDGDSRSSCNRPVRCQLGSVLAHVQRFSHIPLEELASSAGLSLSQMSHILAGEQFPNWRVTESIARICGADPLILRKVWEDEKSRQENSSICRFDRPRALRGDR